MGLNNVLKASHMGHEHCVDVGIAEQWCWHGDGGWDPDFCRLTDLALVAQLDVPPNVVS